MNRSRKIILASIVAAALLGGGLLGAVAFAQTPQPPTPKAAQPADVFWPAFANKLGVNVDAAKAAFREASKAVVAQALKDNKIKQEAADKLNERIDKMPLDQPPMPILPQPQRPAPQDKMIGEMQMLMLHTAANTLGMNSGELMQQLRDGLTLGEIAAQRGVAPDKLKAAMLGVVNTRIDAALKNGNLAQDKANDLKARVEKQLDFDKRFPLPGPQPQNPQPPRGNPVPPGQQPRNPQPPAIRPPAGNP